MIEVIYKDEKQEAKGNESIFSVPKNIRQIGQANDDYRIYMEDYVYTFLGREAGAGDVNGEDKKCLAVLTGETKWASGITYMFIRGALDVEAEDISAEHIEFTEKMWKKIQEETEKYFEGQEIVGWFFSQRSIPLEATELLKRVHLKHFGGGEKVLMLMDPAEREEVFFRYENSFLVKQNGYYLYYEKNPQMQSYMLEKNPEGTTDRQEEVPDEAVKAFRRIIQKKKSAEEKQTEETEERISVFSYAATACLALAVVAAGMKFYQNYQSMQQADVKAEMAASVIETGPSEFPEEIKEKAEVTSVRTERADTGEKEVKDGEKSGETKGEQEGGSESKNEIQENASRNTAKMKKDEKETVPSEAAETDEETSNENVKSELSEEDRAIYREESDMRKAERRVRESRDTAGNSDSEKVTETENNTQSEETSAGGTTYIIRPGDTLYQISVEKYGSMEAVAEICRMNNISESDTIYPGQIIVLP